MTRTNTGRGETHLGLRLELVLLVALFLVVVLVLHEALLACRRVDGLRRALDGLLLLHRKIDRYLELFSGPFFSRSGVAFFLLLAPMVSVQK
jgi:hypothetical protein